MLAVAVVVIGNAIDGGARDCRARMSWCCSHEESVGRVGLKRPDEGEQRLFRHRPLDAEPAAAAGQRQEVPKYPTAEVGGHVRTCKPPQLLWSARKNSMSRSAPMCPGTRAEKALPARVPNGCWVSKPARRLNVVQRPKAGFTPQRLITSRS